MNGLAVYIANIEPGVRSKHCLRKNVLDLLSPYSEFPVEQVFNLLNQFTGTERSIIKNRIIIGVYVMVTISP